MYFGGSDMTVDSSVVTTCLVGMLITAEDVHVLGWRVSDNSVPSPWFCCEPKTAVKFKVYLKNKNKIKNHLYTYFFLYTLLLNFKTHTLIHRKSVTFIIILANIFDA